MQATIEHITEKFGPLMGENDRAFFNRVYATPLDIYENRLQAIEFAQTGTVLDAGCGFGQWSIALARLNDFVHALDVQTDRLLTLQAIIDQENLTNIKTRRGRLESLPYPDNLFDAVFCYGVIFCTDWQKSLAEFRRVLKGGGRLYLTANDLGWYLNLWKNRPNATADYDPRENASLGFRNSIEYEKFGKPPATGQIIIEYEQLLEVVEKIGFRVVAHGGEGTIHLDKTAIAPQPFFKADYFGMLGVYEILLECVVSP